MVRTAALAEIGALIGDPGRANMLAALMDGRALTARELADHAGVTPQTASGHLAKLAAAQLIVVRRQGRSRYHRLASAEIAGMLEGMIAVAEGLATANRTPVRVGPKDAALRHARTCYDHLAGRVGVGLAAVLADRGHIRLDDSAGMLTEEGRRFLCDFGVDLECVAGSRRPLCKSCLDWSERRPHLAGLVGAGLLDRVLALEWVRRQEGTRALIVTRRGEAGLRQTFGLS